MSVSNEMMSFENTVIVGSIDWLIEIDWLIGCVRFANYLNSVENTVKRIEYSSDLIVST